MSSILKVLSVIFILGIGHSFAQLEDMKYQLKGSFPITFPGKPDSTTVDFTLLWNEAEGKILGRYSDNHLVADDNITGTNGEQGRFFAINLPSPVQGVASLTISSQQLNLSTGTVPLTVVAKDKDNNVINQAMVSANVLIRTTMPSTENPCHKGFGALSGYCGIYGGALAENGDSANKCNLQASGFRMELSPTAEIIFYFNFVDTTIGLPTHRLGALQSAPISAVIETKNRTCGNLVQTDFDKGNCFIMALNGSFNDLSGVKTFSGSYIITDEISGNTCRYELKVQK